MVYTLANYAIYTNNVVARATDIKAIQMNKILNCIISVFNEINSSKTITADVAKKVPF